MRRSLTTLVLLAAIAFGSSSAIAGCAGIQPFAPAQPAPVASTAPTLITMPNVAGENAAVAEDKLKRLGFTNITFGTVDGRMVVILPQNWTVKTQSAQPGELIPADVKIVLGCVRNG